MDDRLLLLPGPTPVPPEVREACALPPIGHRGEEFRALDAEIRDRLRALFGTDGAVVVLPCSGTGALEAALVNVLSPGDRVLACVAGEFGERWARAAEAYGLSVRRLEVPPGQVPAPAAVAAAAADWRPRAVLVTHCETSTGALADLPAIAAAVREAAPGALLLADAVSSFAGVPVRLDAWGVDVAVTASQKALMTPPGLGIVALGPRALEAVPRAGLPRFTWDLRPYLEGPGRPPYTPAVTLLLGLRQALRRIAAEGVERVYARHRLMGAMVRAGVRALGFAVLADEAWASPTVTAVVPPPGAAAEIRRRLERDHGVLVAGGQGELADRIFRIGHMGAVTPDDVERALDALDRVAVALGLAGAPAARRAAAAVRARGEGEATGP